MASLQEIEMVWKHGNGFAKNSAQTYHHHPTKNINIAIVMVCLKKPEFWGFNFQILRHKIPFLDEISKSCSNLQDWVEDVHNRARRVHVNLSLHFILNLNFRAGLFSSFFLFEHPFLAESGIYSYKGKKAALPSHSLEIWQLKQEKYSTTPKSAHFSIRTKDPKNRFETETGTLAETLTTIHGRRSRILN